MAKTNVITPLRTLKIRYNMGDIKSFISIYVGSKNTNINSWAKRLVYDFREKIEDSDKREELIEMGIY